MPAFGEVGVKQVYNGAICYTPDGSPIIGPAWGLPNFWLNEGHSFGITAAGGAWNASIVAEHVEFAGHTHSVTGIGALIAEATGRGDYGLLLAATLSMIMAVILINRLLWRRLYRVAEEQFRME